MLNLCLVLFVLSSVYSESVRETETWMPMRSTHMASMSTHHDDLVSSGDFQNGSDFGFTDDEDDDDYYDTYDDEFSGSGDGATPAPTREDQFKPSDKPDMNKNNIPEEDRKVRPTVNEADVIQNSNEIPFLRKDKQQPADYPTNVLMSHASEDSILNKTEVLAALIAGGAVGLMLAILLILLLIYRMKKKDEGSYDVVKKPIYKKAPITEIYA